MLSAEPNPTVVDLKSHSEARAQEAWDRYIAARATAERSAAIEDGIAAGNAWRAFLDLFLSPEQREADRQCDRVMQLRRR